MNEVAKIEQIARILPSKTVEGAYAIFIGERILVDGFVDIEGADIAANINVSLVPFLESSRLAGVREGMEKAAKIAEATIECETDGCTIDEIRGHMSAKAIRSAGEGKP